MSIKIMSQVWETGPAKQSHLLVMLALADYANDSGTCWPSMASIAAKARVTERGARKIVRELEALGWLEIDTGGGRHGCNRYTVNPEQGSPRNDVPPGTAMQETRNSDAQNPEQPFRRTVKNRQKPSKISFDEFWNLVPNKVAKSDAKIAWGKMSLTDRHSAVRYVSDFYSWFKKRHPSAMPMNPARYLENRRWEDVSMQIDKSPTVSLEAIAAGLKSNVAAVRDHSLMLAKRHGLNLEELR